MFNLLDTNIKYSLSILDSQNENIPYFAYISESYFKVSDINISHEITLTARENTIAESELINILSEFSPWTSEVKQVDQSLFDLIFVNKTSHYINSSNILYLHMEPSFLSANFSYDGNLEETQNHVDKLSQSLGIGVPYVIGSYRDDVMLFKSTITDGLKSEGIYLISIIMLLIMFSITIMSAQKEMNQKEDLVRNSEGYYISKSLKEYLIFDIISRFIIAFLTYQIFKINLIYSSFILLIHLVCELLLIKIIESKVK